MRKKPLAKVLTTDPLLRYQFGLARDLHMTHKRLMEELGTGELAYWVAYDELEADARSKQAERAARISEQLKRHGGR